MTHNNDISKFRDYKENNFWHTISYPKSIKNQMIQYFNKFIVSNFNSDTRVYFLSKIINQEDLFVYISAVPMVCINSGNYMVMPHSSKNPYGDSTVFRSNDLIRKKYPYLLTYEERMKARRKIIISNNIIFAHGGYRSDQKLCEVPTPCVIITYAAPQFSNIHLEYQLYIQKQPTKIKLKDKLYFDDVKYLSDMKEDILLILSSIDDYCTDRNKAYIHVVAAGTGLFSNVKGFGNIKEHLYPLLLKAYSHVLENYMFDNIKIICLLDFDGMFKMKRIFDNIKVTYQSNRDVADFEYLKHPEKYTLVAINPGNIFSAVGNSIGYGSVESAMAINTTMVITQNYFYNLEALRNFYPKEIDD